MDLPRRFNVVSHISPANISRDAMADTTYLLFRICSAASWSCHVEACNVVRQYSLSNLLLIKYLPLIYNFHILI